MNPIIDTFSMPKISIRDQAILDNESRLQAPIPS
jgi:hypothetical protein